MSDLSKFVTLLNRTHQGSSDSKVPRLNIYRSITPLSEITHQNVARSPIQSKKQDIKNSSGGEGWKQRGRRVGQNLKKLG